MSDGANQCNTCLVVKPLEDFYKASGMRHGHRGDCKTAILRRRSDATKRIRRSIARVKEWRERNRERLDAYRAEYRRRPERKRAMRDLYYRQTFGITADDVDALLAAQRGACAICGGAPSRADGWHVDHDHGAGRIRGVLCSRCNHAIGLFREDPTRLRRAADYLEGASR